MNAYSFLGRGRCAHETSLRGGWKITDDPEIVKRVTSCMFSCSCIVCENVRAVPCTTVRTLIGKDPTASEPQVENQSTATTYCPASGARAFALAPLHQMVESAAAIFGSATGCS